MEGQANIVELIRNAIQYQLSHLHTCLPGKIVAYDAKTQFATVKPLVQRAGPEGETLSLPEIYNVPVQFPLTQAGSIAFKVQPGDPCLLLFAERGLDAWKRTGEDSAPSPRQFSLTDAFCVLGTIAKNYGGANPDNLDLLLRTQSMSIQADGENLTIQAPNVTVSDGVGGSIRVADGRLSLRGKGGELIALLAQALQAASTGTTGSGPVTPNPALAGLLSQINSLVLA